MISKYYLVMIALLGEAVAIFDSDIVVSKDGVNYEIFGWKVDVAKDRQLRSGTSAPQYDPNCPLGYYRKNWACIWSAPKVVELRKGYCPIGYTYEPKDNKCYNLNGFDPFYVSFFHACLLAIDVTHQ
jgi:hypothetical protein